jgi:hypothetical protein
MKPTSLDNTNMPKSQLSRDDILAAMSNFDKNKDDMNGLIRKWEDNAGFQYAVEHEGKRYPPGILTSIALGHPIRSPKGEQANKTLRELGFAVIRKSTPKRRIPNATYGQGRFASSSLKLGEIYTRDDLRVAFDITDATLNNGIFRPKGFESVWIFVTEEKTPDRVQYADKLVGNVLFMQGQTEGRTDGLITQHVAKGLEILVFHREKKYEHQGAGFRYLGRFDYVRSFGSRPTSFILLREESTPRIYGRQAWKWVLAAVQANGGRATKAEIEAAVLKNVPNFKTTNTDAELQLLSVNHNSRGNHGPNTKSRRTDGISPYDALYKRATENGPVYELYDPAIHGVWTLEPDSTGKHRPKRLGDSPELAAAQRLAEESGAFDASNEKDARAKTLRTIVQRRGQPQFRQKLITAYAGRCAMTGCAVPDILEAAHIKPYMGDHSNHVTNGLLLRADVHTLFDLGLVRIHPHRSGSACLNSFPRFLSGLRAGCQRCRVVHGGGRRLRRTDRRGGQLGAHQGFHLTRPVAAAAGPRSTLRPA